MLSRLTSRLTFANVIALLALVIALGGSAYAAVSLPKNSVGTKQLKKRAVTNSKLANRAVTGAKVRPGSLTGKQIKSSTLGQVPSAAHAGSADTATNAAHAGSADAATNAAHAGSADATTNANHASNSDQLGGSPPSAFFPASKVQTFNAKLAFGETQTLFSAGTLTFAAKCVQNATDPGGATTRDFVELLVSTTQNGGTFTAGDDGGQHGGSPAQFLNTDTTEPNRAVAFVSANTGTSYTDIEHNGSGYGMNAIDPNGVAVIIPDAVTGAVNLFGSNCVLAGFAIIP
jgi:hypothetical protein